MGRPPIREIEDGPAVEWLFVDLNAYFASVEQQERPELRGRPVGVAALLTPNTVCIAASYEAKARGVRTGTKLKDARVLCPEIELVEGRPALYAEYHRRIFAAIGQCLPITAVLSIDEAACRLAGWERRLPNALAIAASVKAAVREVGETLRCSIGLAPNRMLAKIAADMKKPDGLTVLLAEELPQALYGLTSGDIPGVGPKMRARLAVAGIRTMEQLCALSSEELRRAFGSVQGPRLWHALRGAEVEETETERQSLGKQHVLAPELRTRDGAYRVAQKLLHLAAAELRQLELRAGGLGVEVQWLGRSGRNWKAMRKLAGEQETFGLLEQLARAWRELPEGKPLMVRVWFFDLTAEAPGLAALWGDDKRARACTAMDELNRRFGSKAVVPGGVHVARGAAPQRIPFRGIPDEDKFP